MAPSRDLGGVCRIVESFGYPQGLIHCFVRSKALRRARDLKDRLYVSVYHEAVLGPTARIAFLTRTLWMTKLKHMYLAWYRNEHSIRLSRMGLFSSPWY